MSLDYINSADVVIGAILGLVALFLWLIFRFVFAEEIFQKYKKKVLSEENKPKKGKKKVGLKEDILKSVDDVGEFVVKLLRLTAGINSIPNKLLRVFVVVPVIIYIFSFFASEIWNLNFIHWFYVFFITGFMFYLAYEVPSQIVFFKMFDKTRSGASLIGSVMTSAIILCVTGVFVPVHIIDPIAMRFSIMLLVLIGLMVFFVDWLEDDFKVLLIPASYVYMLLVGGIIAIVIGFVFLGGDDGDNVRRSSGTSGTVATIQEKESLNDGVVCSAPTIYEQTENLVKVKPKKGCWSEYIRIPDYAYSYQTMSTSCFSAWVPSKNGNYYIANQLGKYFSCEDLYSTGLSDKGRVFRVIGSTSGVDITFSW